MFSEFMTEKIETEKEIWKKIFLSGKTQVKYNCKFEGFFKRPVWRAGFFCRFVVVEIRASAWKIFARAD